MPEKKTFKKIHVNPVESIDAKIKAIGRGLKSLKKPIPNPQGRQPNYDAPDYEKYYCRGTRPGTFKEWHIWTEGRTVHTMWGPMGKTLQHTPNEFGTYEAMRDEYRRLVREKEKKGYRQNLQEAEQA